jgi:hypothetical protein
LRGRHLRALTSSPDTTFVLAGEPRVLVPPGDYSAVMVRHEIQEKFRRKTLVLWLRVVALDGANASYDRALVPMYFPMTTGSFSAGSKFATLWARLTGRRPQKGERMTTAVLLGRLLRVRTRTVTHDHRQRPHGVLTTYAVVDDILSVEVGESAGQE